MRASVFCASPHFARSWGYFSTFASSNKTTNACPLKEFNILAIESSCDDTGLCVLSSTPTTLTSTTSDLSSHHSPSHHSPSQHSLSQHSSPSQHSNKILFEKTLGQDVVHGPNKGIIPSLAAKTHWQALPRLLAALANSGSSRPVHAIAATRGPGLAASLAVGWNSARVLASYLNVPLLGVHHMEAHALMPRYFFPWLAFPYVCLLISGGHTLLLLVHNALGTVQVLGSTLDDAVGEALDKGARTLGLAWLQDAKARGLAAALEICAQKGNAQAYSFTQPLLKPDARARHQFDFSFSGLKTRLGDLANKAHGGVLSETVVCDLAASYQNVIASHLVCRLESGIQYYLKQHAHAQHAVVVSGGVARNAYIRARLSTLASKYNLPLCIPPPAYCTDNALMIAWTALERLHASSWTLPELHSELALNIAPDWPLDPTYNNTASS